LKYTSVNWVFPITGGNPPPGVNPALTVHYIEIHKVVVYTRLDY